MSTDVTVEVDFPCSLVIDIPFPTARLARSALQVIQVDQELSPLVRRSLSLATSDGSLVGVESTDVDATILRTEYRATTNRMLRVAVNGFMESIGVVLGVMEELDVDVLGARLNGGPSR